MSDFDANKIAAEVITDLSKSVAKKLYGKCKEFIGDVIAKDEINFGLAFEDYLIYTTDIYSKVKTLLYRHTPKDIYSFYESVGVLKGVKEHIDTSNINNVLDIGNKIIITGTGGIGKSMMMKHFFLNTVKNTTLIPVFVELRGLNNTEKNSINIDKYIYNIMRNLKFNLEKKYFDYSLETGCYVILFDGFDELKNDISNIVTQKIFELCDRYPDNYYIVSSRPLQEFIGWNQFEEVKAMRLTKRQALSLINKLDYDINIKDKFSEALDKELYNKYRSFASNPLLLTIMLMTFENRVSIPDKLNDFFEQAFSTLFHTHDATKGGYSREVLCKLGFEDFRTIFAHFCFKSFFNSDYEFSESKIIEYIEKSKLRKLISKDFETENYLKDLTKSVCMLIHEGLNYKFSHRSFQEYFAAVYTVQLDDEQQKEFISKWLSQNSYRANTNYLDMLYDLQPSRFIKNIIKPALEELNSKYIFEDKSNIWLIKTMYDSLLYRLNDEDDYEICISISNLYYHDMIKRSCIINNYDYSKYKLQHNQELMYFLKSNYSMHEHIGIEEIVDLGYEKELLDELAWVIDRFNFAVTSLQDTENQFTGKDIKSMLDEL